jgi:phenylpropionate dioxygenase-like ring-hydroxylating dioxygenase large terminal subunit
LFIHQSRLRHLLQPSDYFSPRQHALELERLFRPGWHCVASMAQLPRPGDFITLDLLGQPLIAWNVGGEAQVFLNVCAHRHCLLIHAPRGQSARLRCQYHGWEYNGDGSTGHIPDARSFRPFDRENSRLSKVRTATCGELIFATLDDEAPPLCDYLGPFYDQCHDWFTAPFRWAGSWTMHYAANWKAAIENSIESYHVPCVHAKSFGILPPEEQSWHELSDRWSTFRSAETNTWRSKIQAGLVRSLGLPVSQVYIHHLAHPNLAFVKLDGARLAFIVLPTSASTSEHRVWLFAPEGPRRDPWAWLIRKWFARFALNEARKILAEDAGILGDVQRGLTASPHRGVIGSREERVYTFQKFILTACGREDEIADGAAGGDEGDVFTRNAESQEKNRPE